MTHQGERKKRGCSFRAYVHRKSARYYIEKGAIPYEQNEKLSKIEKNI